MRLPGVGSIDIDGTAGTLSLYLNGALAASDTGAGDLYNHGQSAIGAQRSWARYHTGGVNGALNYFDGTIDEIAVYNSILNGTAIAAHYAVGSASSTDPRPGAKCAATWGKA